MMHINAKATPSNNTNYSCLLSYVMSYKYIILRVYYELLIIYSGLCFSQNFQTSTSTSILVVLVLKMVIFEPHSLPQFALPVLKTMQS